MIYTLNNANRVSVVNVEYLRHVVKPGLSGVYSKHRASTSHLRGAFVRAMNPPYWLFDHRYYRIPFIRHGQE
jgi:hypothetical protein